MDVCLQEIIDLNYTSNWNWCLGKYTKLNKMKVITYIQYLRVKWKFLIKYDYWKLQSMSFFFHVSLVIQEKQWLF